MFDHGVTHFEAYIDFVVGMQVEAPDQFVELDFLPEEHQLNLESGFRILNEKLYLVEPHMKQPGVMPQLRELLKESQAAYEAGEDIRGAHLLQDFESLILKNATHRDD